MKSVQILSILAGGAIVGWYGPDVVGAGGGQSVAAETAAPGPQGERSGLARERRFAVNHGGAGASDNVLERQRDGHFYAQAMVDGQDVRFLVDTGASMVALTGADAQAMGLQWEDTDLVRVGRGANGDVMGIPVTIDHIELAGFEARGVEGAIIPEGLDVSLLGQTFLSQIRNVEISGDRMVLGG